MATTEGSLSVTALSYGYWNFRPSGIGRQERFGSIKRRLPRVISMVFRCYYFLRWYFSAFKGFFRILMVYLC